MPDDNQDPKPQDPKPTTSQDIVDGGKFTAGFKKLETRIATLEDTNKTLTERNQQLEKTVGALVKLPSQTGKKSLLEDLEEFVFGAKPSNGGNTDS